ncbi:MAG: MBL fold metallo-hydrolase [Desulfobulbaceae bacterium]|nr:MBL fold metallo-hydrolase [Desulfobulbaceae bacterium]
MEQLSLGNIKITWLSGGSFKLDGGTMYGAVPKVLWQQKFPADQDNCIKMLNAPLLVQTEEFNLVVDTGLGNKLTGKQQEVFRVEQSWSIPEDLEKLGLHRQDIHYVILTHGDFDHAGGVMMVGENGNHELTFPAAKHVIQSMEWQDITNTNRRSAHTYWPDNFSGLKTNSNLLTIKGDREIVPGVTTRLTGGHTRGHQLVEIKGSEGCAVHLGDVLPTHTHTNPLWIMAYDNFPLEIIEQKENLLPHYSKKGCWFTFYHDPFMKACQLDEKGTVVKKIP